MFAGFLGARPNGKPSKGKQKIRTLLLQEKGSDFSDLVDLIGIEPTTLRMRTVRSPRLSYRPIIKPPSTDGQEFEIQATRAGG